MLNSYLLYSTQRILLVLCYLGRNAKGRQGKRKEANETDTRKSTLGQGTLCEMHNICFPQLRTAQDGERLSGGDRGRRNMFVFMTTYSVSWDFATCWKHFVVISVDHSIFVGQARNVGCWFKVYEIATFTSCLLCMEEECLD